MIALWHRVGAVPFWGSLFLLYAGASILWSPGDKLWAAAVVASLAGAFLAGRLLVDLRRVWQVYCAFIVVNVCFVLLSNQIPFGIYGNPNYLGCAVAMAFVGALVYRQWWFLPIGGLGLLLTQSRGAIFATGLGLLLFTWSKSKLGALALLGLAILLVANLKPGSAEPFVQRMGFWQDTVTHFTIFGSGFGSFFEAYGSWPLHTSEALARPAHAYNDLIEVLFELGIGTIPLWVALILAFEAQSPQRLICVTFFALGLTFFPLFVLPCGQLFAMAVGQLSRERKPYGSLETDPSPLPIRTGYRVGV